MKKISVITLVYNEAEAIKDVYANVKKVFDAIKGQYEYEHIFMDNCSEDETVSILKDIASRDKNIKILVYSKNFGPLKSEMTGYKYVTGDAAICYESSLKDPAGLIPVFIKHWEDGYQVVYGERTRTHDNFLMLFMRRAFYRIVRFFSDEKLPLDAGGFRLIDRGVINELIKLDDYKPYIRGLISSIGFKQIGVKYVRGPRLKGHSKSSINYLIDFAINALVSYSVAPIRICTYIGLSLSLLSFTAAIACIVIKLAFWNIVISGLATVIILILLFFGVQLFFLGVIGEYIAAIHSQVRKKPFVVIHEKINFYN